MLDKQPLISIVIPSYNKVKFIKKTLDSIFDQKYLNFEVIIQDGGSTDGTLKIIKHYIQKYPNKIILESKKDNGQLDAINKGMKKAKGEIVAFINADDVYEKDALFTVSEYYKENPKALWFAGRGIVIDEKDNEIAKLASFYKSFLLRINAYGLLLITNYLMQPSVFITKKAYINYGPFIGTKDFVLEYDLWLKLSKIQMPVVINKILSSFRIEANTKTMNVGKKLLAKDYKLVKKYTQDKFILYLHLFHNKLRLLVSKFI